MILDTSYFSSAEVPHLDGGIKVPGFGQILTVIDNGFGGLSYPLGNCGAGLLQGFGFGQCVLKTPEIKQDWIAQFLKVHGDFKRWFFLPSSDQLNSMKDGVLLHFLIAELGAKEIYRGSNQYHRPHDMHMFVIDFLRNENLYKYVDPVWNGIRELESDSYHKYHFSRVQYIPKWWTEKYNKGISPSSDRLPKATRLRKSKASAEKLEAFIDF